MNPADYWDNEAMADPRYREGKWHINLGDDPDEVLLEVLRRIWPHVPETGRAIEIGVGPARILMPTAMNFPGVDWVGLDISPVMIALARPKVAALPNASVELVGEEWLVGPTVSNFLDLVYMVEVPQHLNDETLESYIIWSYATLKPGGRLVFQFVNELAAGNEGPFSHPRSLADVHRMFDGDPWADIRFDQGAVHEQWTWVVATR